MGPEISYVIVTYGRKDDLLECIKSINDNAISKDSEIIVVDNKNEIEVEKTVSSFENVRYFAFLKHPYPFLKYLFVNLSNPYKIFSYLRLGIQARREGGIKRRKI